MADEPAESAPCSGPGDSRSHSGSERPGEGGGVRHVMADELVAGQRIDNYLLRELSGIPKSRIYRMLRKGEVRVNGGRVKPTYRLQSGDTLRIPPVRDAAPATPTATFIGDKLLTAVERAILYEDEHLLALNKPAGLAVHGGSGLAFGVIEVLRRLRPDDALALAHRLDRDTSGCLLVAKDRATLLALHRALRERTVSKQYVAAVHGSWPRRLRTVRLALERYHTPSGERRVRVSGSGKPSRTDFEVLAQGGSATLVRAHLHSGRTHQIRVHAQASGHPVVGDEKYATPEQLALAASKGIKRLCLHAETLVFEHAGRRLRLTAELPVDFQEAWALLS